MKTLPYVENNYSHLHDMIMAPIRTKLLLAAIELGIFDEMNSFRSARDIAAAVGTHTGNTEQFLNALVTIGLADKKDGLYRNQSDTADFLVKKSPTYLGSFFELFQRMCVDTLDDLVDRIKDGPPPADDHRDFSAPKVWAEATRASAGWVTGGVGTQMADRLSRLPEFSGFRKMLDLGGGHGMFALYFVDTHPDMTAVVFDRPAVVTVADDFIQKYGMQDRVSVLAGDYLADDIGAGYDFIWACATLNFARHNLEALFRKVFNALNDGGIFAAFQDGMTHEQTQPDIMLGHLGEAVRSKADFFFDQGEISDAMLGCGFRSVRSQTVETPMGSMDLDIARK